MKSNPLAADPAPPVVSHVDVNARLRQANEAYHDAMQNDPAAAPAALEQLQKLQRERDSIRLRESAMPSRELAECAAAVDRAERRVAVAERVAFAAPQVPFADGEDPKRRAAVIRTLQASNDAAVRLTRGELTEARGKLAQAHVADAERVAEQRRLMRQLPAQERGSARSLL